MSSAHSGKHTFQMPSSPSVLGGMDELIVLCLLAKIWGEILPLALIIAETKLD